MVNFNPTITDKLNSFSTGLLAGHYIFSRDYDDAYLAKRFSKPDAYPHNISYEFSHDHDDLQKYYDIRSFAYKETLGIENDFDHEDPFDQNSYVLIVRAGSQVVGGARLTVSSPEHNQLMPLEAEGFDLRENFPQLDFSHIKYCEMSRLALMPEFRNNIIAEQIHQKFIDVCTLDGIHIGFARTTPLQQRRTKTIFNNLGYEMIIRRDIKLQPHKHLDMQFSCVDFTADRRFSDLLRYRPSPQNALEAKTETEFA